jgi:hypothetical protein
MDSNNLVSLLETRHYERLCVAIRKLKKIYKNGQKCKKEQKKVMAVELRNYLSQLWCNNRASAWSD